MAIVAYPTDDGWQVFVGVNPFQNGWGMEAGIYWEWGNMESVPGGGVVHGVIMVPLWAISEEANPPSIIGLNKWS